MKRNSSYRTPSPGRGASPAEPGQARAGSGAGGTSSERRLRPRSGVLNYADQHPELDDVLGGDDEGARGKRRRLDIPNLCAQVEYATPAQLFATTTHPSQVTAEALAAAGLRQPLLIPAAACGKGGAAATRAALGMQLLPVAQLTPRGIAAAVGRDHQVTTIDVATQDSGPRMTMRQLAEYHEQQQRQPQHRLLNVVSLSLADTDLEDDITPPWAVRGLDLVSSVWPPEDDPDDSEEDAPPLEPERPETLLYALMGPAGAYTDWHVDMGGSAVWYHMVSGRKVFLAAPPTPSNLAAFEDWSSSGKQASTWLGDHLEGLLRINLCAGDTLLLPSAWPHAVATPEAAVAVGGNFLTPLDYGAIADCYRRERRLGVTTKFQFPLFRKLMWYAAENALARLRRCVGERLRPAAAGIGRWELGGLPSLLGLLREWQQQQVGGGPGRRSTEVPSRVADPAAMLEELEGCLKAVQALHPQEQEQRVTRHRQQLQHQQQQQPDQPDQQPFQGAPPALGLQAGGGEGADAGGAGSGGGPPSSGSEYQQHLGLALALGGGGSDGQLGFALALALGDAEAAAGGQQCVFGVDGPQAQADMQQQQGTVDEEGNEGRDWLDLRGGGDQLLVLPGDDLIDHDAAAAGGALSASLLNADDLLQSLPLPLAGAVDVPHALSSPAGDADVGPAAAALLAHESAHDRAMAWAAHAVMGGGGSPSQQHHHHHQQQSLSAASVLRRRQLEGGSGPTATFHMVPVDHSRDLAVPNGTASGTANGPHLAAAHSLYDTQHLQLVSPVPRAGAGTTVGARRRRLHAQQHQQPQGQQHGRPGKKGQQRGSGPEDGDAAYSEYSDSSGGSSSSGKGSEEDDKPWLLRGTQASKQQKPQRLTPRRHRLKGKGGNGRTTKAPAPGSGGDGGANSMVPAKQRRHIASTKGAAHSKAAIAGKQGTGAARGPTAAAAAASRDPRAAARAAVGAGSVPVALNLQPLGRKTDQPNAAGLAKRRMPQQDREAQQAQQKLLSRVAASPLAALASLPTAARPATAAAGAGSPRPHGTSAGSGLHQPVVRNGRVQQQAQQQAPLPGRFGDSGRSPQGLGQAPDEEGQEKGGGEAGRRLAAAEALVQEVVSLRAAVLRDEALLANVQAGVVPLADGGVKLAAALAQRRDLLRRKRDLAAGRVLSYQEAGSAAAQGPFTAGELEKLLRAGLLGEGTPVTHPQLGVMPLSEALLLPEPLSAGLLREREGAQQQLGSQAPGQLPQHEQHQPHPQREQSQQQSQHGQYQQQQPQLGQYQQQHQQQEQYQQHHKPSRWAAHGRWNGGSAAGGGREQQRQWEEMDARLKREVEEEAALEEEAAMGMWTFVNQEGDSEGPYTKAELRRLYLRGELLEDILVHEEEQGVSVRLYALLELHAVADEAAAARARDALAAQQAQQAQQQALQQQAHYSQQQQQAQQHSWQPVWPAAGAAAGMVQHPQYDPQHEQQQYQQQQYQSYSPQRDQRQTQQEPELAAQQQQQQQAVPALVDDWDDSIAGAEGAEEAEAGGELYEPSPASSPAPPEGGAQDPYSPTQVAALGPPWARAAGVAGIGAGQQSLARHQQQQQQEQQQQPEQEHGQGRQGEQDQQQHAQGQDAAGPPLASVLEAPGNFPAGFAPLLVLPEVAAQVLASASPHKSGTAAHGSTTAAQGATGASAAAAAAAAAAKPASPSAASMDIEEPAAAAAAEAARCEASSTLHGSGSTGRVGDAGARDEPPPPPPLPPLAPIPRLPQAQHAPALAPVPVLAPAPMPALAPLPAPVLAHQPPRVLQVPQPSPLSPSVHGPLDSPLPTASRPQAPMHDAPRASTLAMPPTALPVVPLQLLPDSAALAAAPSSAAQPAWQPAHSDHQPMAVAGPGGVASTSLPTPWQQTALQQHQQQQPHWHHVPQEHQEQVPRQGWQQQQQSAPWAGSAAVGVAAAGGSHVGANATGTAFGSADVGAAVAAFAQAMAAQQPQLPAVPHVQQQWPPPMHRQAVSHPMFRQAPSR